MVDRFRALSILGKICSSSSVYMQLRKWEQLILLSTRWWYVCFFCNSINMALFLVDLCHHLINYWNQAGNLNNRIMDNQPALLFIPPCLWSLACGAYAHALSSLTPVVGCTCQSAVHSIIPFTLHMAMGVVTKWGLREVGQKPRRQGFSITIEGFAIPRPGRWGSRWWSKDLSEPLLYTEGKAFLNIPDSIN